MDPDETLANLLEALHVFDEANDAVEAVGAAELVAQAFHDLDDWLCRGGFIPRRWANGSRGS